MKELRLKGKITQLFKRKKEDEMKKGLEAVKDVYIETDENAKIEAAKRAIEEIKKHPESAIRFLKMMEDEKGIPVDIVVETVKHIPVVQSEEVAVQAIKKLQLPSKGIQAILQKPEVSIDAATQMVEQIPDEKIQKAEERRLQELARKNKEKERAKREIEIRNQLIDMYIKCDNISIMEMIDKVKEFDDQTKSRVIHGMIKQVIARKVASEWRIIGSARIPTIVNVISAEEMIQGDFADLVERKYNGLNKSNKYKQTKKYDKEVMQQLILAELAKNIAKTYAEYGIIDIPKSGGIKRLTPELQEFLINQIKIYARDIKDIDEVRAKVQGGKDYELKDLITMIERMPEDKKSDCISLFKSQIRGEKGNNLSERLEGQIDKIREALPSIEEKRGVEILEDALDEIKDEKEAEVVKKYDEYTGR